MQSVAFNPRGTSGSGKTYLVRNLIRRFAARPDTWMGIPINNGLYKDLPVVVIGNYANACGGCDGIQPYARLLEVIEYYMTPERTALQVLLIYEGLLISHSIGSIGELVRKHGRRHVMAFLDTPLDTCLDRIQLRRDERGDTRPFNPANTIKDYKAVQQCRKRAIHGGFRVENIPHLNPIETSLEIIDELYQLACTGQVD